MEVYGIDISWSMLREGMRKVAREHVAPMNFAHARVEKLPFSDYLFDAAYCGGALHGFPDTVGSLREIGGDQLILRPITHTLLEIRGSVPVATPQDFAAIRRQMIANHAEEIAKNEG